MTWTTLIVVSSLLFLLPVWVLGLWRRESQHQADRLVERTRSIINFSYAGGIAADAHNQLLLRAEANKRLVSAFGIRNSFTTADVAVHQEFSRAVSKGLKPTNATWQRFYRDATLLLENELQEAAAHGRHSLRLAPLAQGVCLRIILAAFFDADPFAPSRGDISCITEEINRQWMLSKRDPKGVEKSELLNTAVMNLGLKSLFHDGQGVESAEEALSFIIPAYETLWRVVLLVYVNAYHRVRDPGATAEIVKDVPACLGIPGREDEALKLAKEGLRLYPSTKRIHRVLLPDLTGLLSADVESCHTHTAIWGADAGAFRPHRFDALTAAQERAYFPFGLTPRLCPAYHGFGNRMVTLLVVALGRVFSPARAFVAFHNVVLDGLREAPLPAGREDMAAWEVVMV